MAYPVNLTASQDEGQNRLWGIPLLGIIVRWILVIPQWILLFFLGLGMFVFVLVNWIPILVNGRQAGWGYSLFEAYSNVYARVQLYVGLITGTYPGFGWSGEHPVRVTIERGERQNRLWGIPFIGIYARWIILIPHWFVLFFLALGVAFVLIVTWIPVLLSGRQAPAIVNFVAGTYRWGLRVAAYALLLTGSYPPFRLSE